MSLVTCFHLNFIFLYLGCEVKADVPVTKVMENVVKMATSILKFIVDAATIGSITYNHARCLKFASGFARYVISLSGGQRKECAAFKDEDLKDVLVYLKSSFSYASKLLHLVLTSFSESSVPPREAFYLANDLLDLIVTIELSLGSKYASHVLSVAKPWLPVLILGLGSNHLIKAREQEGTSSSGDFTALPFWLAVLGKSELYESSKLSSKQDNEQSKGEDTDVEPNVPVFKKLMEIVVLLLKKGNLKVLDAAGSVLLIGVKFGLEGADFGLVFGLLHFICMKLLGKEFTSWKDIELMVRSLEEIYLRIEKELGESDLSEDGEHVLESAKELLGSVCKDPK